MDTGLDKKMTCVFHISSPAFPNGTGYVVEKKRQLSVNFAPCCSKAYSVDGILQILHLHLVLQGDTTRFEFGASITAYYKFQFDDQCVYRKSTKYVLQLFR
jgi:hypothetical protein